MINTEIHVFQVKDNEKKKKKRDKGTYNCSPSPLPPFLVIRKNYPFIIAKLISQKVKEPFKNNHQTIILTLTNITTNYEFKKLYFLGRMDYSIIIRQCSSNN